jgi:hypothetical protein
MENLFIESFLPTGLLGQFAVTGIEELGQVKFKRMNWYIYLEEKNILPDGYEAIDYESKGFFPVKYIQDFPIRGKAVYLVIKRRRWRLKVDSTKEISTDCLFITEGSKLTQELSDFLKGTGRDPGRYDHEHS